MKIALGSYRLFYIPRTEDNYCRIREEADLEALRIKERKYDAACKKRFNDLYGEDEPSVVT